MLGFAKEWFQKRVKADVWYYGEGVIYKRYR